MFLLEKAYALIRFGKMGKLNEVIEKIKKDSMINEALNPLKICTATQKIHDSRKQYRTKDLEFSKPKSSNGKLFLKIYLEQETKLP